MADRKHRTPPPPGAITRPPTDAELVERAQSEREAAAFGELVRRHQPRIRALLMRLTRGDRTLTEDLTQEAFFRAYRGLSSFEGRSRFSTWLHRIAYYAYLNHCNRAPSHTALPEGFENMVVAPDSEHSHRRYDLRRDISYAVRNLPQRYREVIEMHFVAHVPYRDIADSLDIPLGTVKTQLHRAKLMLRESMDGWGARRRWRRSNWTVTM
jgi:RNA polymerase sigma-70 factor (ECF subfamily)